MGEGAGWSHMDSTYYSAGNPHATSHTITPALVWKLYLLIYPT